MNQNQYKWLVVVEGSTDVKAYSDLLETYGVPSGMVSVFPAHGRGCVCNATTWNDIKRHGTCLLDTLIHDSGRTGFIGVVLVVDADMDGNAAFSSYRRSSDPRLIYIADNAPSPTRNASYWELDSIKGVRAIPIFGVVVPNVGSGCLETDLLNSYGFPVEGQEEYSQFVNIIKKCSNSWQIPLHGDGKEWWVENPKAKLDKFIYSALSNGFKVSREKPQLPNEPVVIGNIKSAIGI